VELVAVGIQMVMEITGPYWRTFEKVLLATVLLEATLGGNGYLVQMGETRLRVLLFSICLVWTLLRLTAIAPVKVPRELIWLSVFYVGLLIADAAMGYYRGNKPEAILAELKPLSYFPMIFFFIVTIRKRQDATLVASILASGGTLVAILYLMILASMNLGLVKEVAVWQFFHVSDEFIFRGYPIIGFLYKGAFYIVIAAIFLMFDPFKYSKILAAVTVVATAMTLTRGLALALMVCIVVGVILGREWRRLPMFAVQVALLVCVVFIASRYDSNYLTSPGEPSEKEVAVSKNSESVRKPQSSSMASREAESVIRPTDTGRIADIKWFIENCDWSMTLFGRGLGTPFREPTRERIELNYIEVFYKQGIWGLAVWLSIFAYTFRSYLRTPRATRKFGLAFFLSSLFVFVANMTNPFLPGSIGMAPVFVALASLLVLSTEEPRPMVRTDWYGE
jgi:hypothetical protein